MMAAASFECGDPHIRDIACSAGGVEARTQLPTQSSGVGPASIPSCTRILVWPERTCVRRAGDRRDAVGSKHDLSTVNTYHRREPHACYGADECHHVAGRAIRTKTCVVYCRVHAMHHIELRRPPAGGCKHRSPRGRRGPPGRRKLDAVPAARPTSVTLTEWFEPRRLFVVAVSLGGAGLVGAVHRRFSRR